MHISNPGLLFKMVYGKPKFPEDIQDTFAVLLFTETLSKILLMLGSLYFVYFLNFMFKSEDIMKEDEVKERKETIFVNISEKPTTH